MKSQTNKITYCKEWQDIFDGIVPGVILAFEDTRDGTQIYLDSLKVAIGEMTKQQYLEKYSPYYHLHPELKTCSNT